MKPLSPWMFGGWLLLAATPEWAGDRESGAAAPARETGWVTVGHPGNHPDRNGLGTVAEPFQIMRHEVTCGQYAEFLNAVATSDPRGLWDVAMGNVLARETDPPPARVWIPSEDEWYKAADLPQDGIDPRSLRLRSGGQERVEPGDAEVPAMNAATPKARASTTPCQPVRHGRGPRTRITAASGWRARRRSRRRARSPRPPWPPTRGPAASAKLVTRPVNHGSGAGRETSYDRRECVHRGSDEIRIAWRGERPRGQPLAGT